MSVRMRCGCEERDWCGKCEGVKGRGMEERSFSSLRRDGGGPRKVRRGRGLSFRVPRQTTSVGVPHVERKGGPIAPL